MGQVCKPGCNHAFPTHCPSTNKSTGVLRYFMHPYAALHPPTLACPCTGPAHVGAIMRSHKPNNKRQQAACAAPQGIVQDGRHTAGQTARRHQRRLTSPVSAGIMRWPQLRQDLSPHARLLSAHAADISNRSDPREALATRGIGSDYVGACCLWLKDALGLATCAGCASRPIGRHAQEGGTHGATRCCEPNVAWQ